MKFILGILCSALAQKLDPAAPFDALPASEYAQFLSVDPNIAANTGRPNCLDGKCHFKAKAVGEIYADTMFNEKPTYGFEKTPDGKWTKILSGPNLRKDFEGGNGESVGLGYTGENYIVENGRADNLKWFGMIRPNTMLTIHLKDYLDLLNVNDSATMLHYFKRVLVLTPSDATGLVHRDNVFWIVSTHAEGQVLDSNNEGIYVNILVQEKTDFDGEALLSDDAKNFCKPQ